MLKELQKNHTLKILWNLIRWLITLTILFLVFRKIRISEIWNAIKSIRIEYFILAFIACLIQQIITAFRWYFILKKNSIEISFFKALKVYFISILFQSFLPTGLGGDAARFAMIVKKGKGAESLNSLIIARMVGFFVLAVFVFTGSFFVEKEISYSARFWSLLFIIAEILIIVIIKYLIPVLNLKRFIGKRAFLDKIIKTILNLNYNLKTSLFLPLLLITFILQIISMVPFYYIFLAMKITPSVWKIITAIPIITLMVTVIPSINGIGAREYFLFFFFKKEFITQSIMAVFSLSLYATFVLILIISAILWLTDRD